jgi:hypothetical protein
MDAGKARRVNLRLEKCPAPSKPSRIDWHGVGRIASEALRWVAGITLLWFLALALGLSAANKLDEYELPIREIRAWAWEVTR